MLRLTDPRSGALLCESQQRPINPNANKPDRQWFIYIAEEFG
ncbi:MAG: hypothetical protein O2960_09315 [Verrucomicrobia bacterium]|nr:hypothetical protein [Verrucomicrobiota bacterium]